ncbi:MFS family permease [Rhodopseudomonas julia]|uniref:MFS family permease n=1 Tax=Rhodopseudomonas julia TaxID=200617 RepID=A0ABU0C6H8_9BRAD|nr:MFS transporter [Rhodopseudomonas julia]MDQ0326129.1 MFS family permease [Rhodopseudomonas julia]
MNEQVPIDDRNSASASTAASGKGGIPGWWITIFLFWLGWVFMYADRTVLSPVMQDIQNEFGLNGTELGLISSLFFLAYAALQIPAGILGDRIGRKKVLVPGFLLFGVFTAVSGMVKTFPQLIAARIITGVGEGTYYGPQYGISSEQIPQKFRSLGSAIINSGMAFGIALGLMMSSWVAYTLDLGWRMPFYVLAVLTLITGVLIWILVKERPRAASAEGKSQGSSFKSLIKNRNLLLTYLMVFCSLFGFFMILTWLPYYLQTERGIPAENIGNIASLVAWVSIPGGLLFAHISDRLGKRRPLVLVLVPIAAISLVSIAFLDDVNQMIAAICVYGFFGKLALDPVLIANVADNASKESYGTAFGIFNFVGMSSSILAPTIAGMIADATGSLAANFYLSAVILIVGMLGMMFMKDVRNSAVEKES